MTNREWLERMGRERGFNTRPFTEPDPAFALPEPDDAGISWVDWQDNATHGENIGVDAQDQLWVRGYGPGTDKSVPEPESWKEGESIGEYTRRWSRWEAESWGYDEPRRMTVSNHEEWFALE